MTATIHPFPGTLVRVPPQPAPADLALARERIRIEGRHCTRTTTGERVYVSEVRRDGAALLGRCWSSGTYVDVQSFRLVRR